MGKVKEAAVVDSLPEWKKNHIEMTRLVWANVLDPIMTFAELVRGYDGSERGIDFTKEEISATLRLLVLGGYTQSKMYCATGGHEDHTSGDLLEEQVMYCKNCR